jgi:subtilase family serine protease
MTPLSIGRVTFAIVALAAMVAWPTPGASADKVMLFTPAVNLSRNPTTSQAPSLVIDDAGSIHVTWSDTPGRIGVMRSADGGSTFSAPVFITPSDEVPYLLLDARIAPGAAGVVHVAAGGFGTDGFADIAYFRSADGGRTFQTGGIVSGWDWLNSVAPAIAADADGRVAIVWQDVNLYDAAPGGAMYTESVDGGATFTLPHRLDAHGYCPDVAMSGPGERVVAWSTITDIRVARSSDGETFTAAVPVSEPGPRTWCPRIVRDPAGTLYVLWLQGEAWRDRTVWLARSRDGGASFGAPQRLSPEGIDAVCPDIAVASGGSVYVVWAAIQGVDRYPSFLAFSSDSGATFSRAVGIAERAACGGLAARGPDEIHLAWHDNPPGQQLSDIFYSRAVKADAGADLAVTSVSSATPLAIGRPITVTATVANQGSLAAAASTLGLYLSANAGILPGSSHHLGVQSIAGLAAGQQTTVAATVTIPADVGPGTYYVGACTDPDAQLADTDRANDCRGTPVALAVTPSQPDLAITQIAGPGTAVKGRTVAITATVRNHGVAPAAAVTVGLYVSRSAVTNVWTDRLVGRWNVPVLDAGSQSTATTVVTIPADLFHGTYFFGACADPAAAIVELDETNNCGASSAVLITDGQDLLLTALSAPLAAAGRPVTITSTVRNQGTSRADVFQVVFYLSNDAVLDTADRLLGSRTVIGLGAGATSTAATTLAMPADVPGGSYFLIAIADPDADVWETDETNNRRATRVTVVQPDLVVSALTAPRAAASGGSLTLTYTVKNQARAPAAAAASMVAFYLSPEATLDAAGATLLATRPVPALAAGAAAGGRVTVALPAVASGPYWLVAVADADGGVRETDETNNTRAIPVTVGADLVVTAASVTPRAFMPGARVWVGATVKNQGGVASGAAALAYYLSRDATMTGAVPLGAPRPIRPLAPGQSAGLTTALTLPPDTSPGAYRIVVTASLTDVRDADETNNVASTATVSVVLPDLLVSSLTVTMGPTNGSVTLRYTVKNQAPSPAIAAGSTLGLYVSSDPAADLATATPAGTRLVPRLGPGASASGTLSIVLPPGTYYVTAVADLTGMVEEAEETNNARVSSFVVAAAATDSARRCSGRCGSGDATR